MIYPTKPVADFSRSVSVTHKKDKSHLIFLNTSDIERGQFLHRNYSEVQAWPGQAKKSIQKDDILFSEIRPGNGRWAFVDFNADDYVVSTKLMVLRVDQKYVIPKFFYLWVSSPSIVDRLQSLAESRSGTFPQITFDDLSFLDCPLPDIHIQQEIVEAVEALDDKIELNRRMSATLEDMARSLYRSWFVDFDPVHAKMDDRQPAFMDEATAALFPARFGQDGLPEGWMHGTLRDIANLNPEKFTSKNHPETVEYVDLSNTKWGVIEATTYYIWSEAPSRARMALREGDTIVGTVRPGNGSYSYVGKDGLTGSTGFAVLRPIRSADTALVYLSATDSDKIDALTNLADGGAYPAVRPEVVFSQSIVIAPETIRDQFQVILAPIIAKIEASKTENSSLAALRDSLLPKLMSGEIRVGEAREQVEEVA